MTGHAQPPRPTPAGPPVGPPGPVTGMANPFRFGVPGSSRGTEPTGPPAGMPAGETSALRAELDKARRVIAQLDARLTALSHASARRDFTEPKEADTMNETEGAA